MHIDLALQSSKNAFFLGHYDNSRADTPYSLSQTGNNMLYQKHLLFTGFVAVHIALKINSEFCCPMRFLKSYSNNICIVFHALCVNASLPFRLLEEL